jgi:hypothetical protein
MEKTNKNFFLWENFSHGKKFYSLFSIMSFHLYRLKPFVSFEPMTFFIPFRVEFFLGNEQFVEKQQRFTVRADNKTIGTGVITECLPARTEAEKEKKVLKALIKAEMERLGFNPYGEHMEKRCKPNYGPAKGKKKNPMADVFQKIREETKQHEEHDI